MIKITTALESHLTAEHGDVSPDTKALLDVIDNRIGAYQEATMVLLASVAAQNTEGFKVSLEALRVLVEEDSKIAPPEDPDRA